MKKETLHVSLLQADLVWENAQKNRAQLEQMLGEVPAKTDLIVLPEMFTTGFSMNPKPLAETMEGATIKWMTALAQKTNSAICGSLIIAENNLFYNRFLFVDPAGNIHQYDKRHTFNMAGEGKQYQAGEKPVLIQYLGWKIFPQICYDLRFPVFARNTHNYDVLIYVANWPKTRVAAWDTLLKARAIENMSYCIGVNRVGVDGNGLAYVGHSAVYDVLGGDQIFSRAIPQVCSTTLLKSHINDTRRKLPFLQDRDTFTLQ